MRKKVIQRRGSRGPPHGWTDARTGPLFLRPSALLPPPRLHALPDDGSAADDGGEPHEPGGGHYISQGPDGLCHRGETGEDADEPSEETEPFGGAGPPQELRQQEVAEAVAANGH